jgi:Amt family ammonium transporter
MWRRFGKPDPSMMANGMLAGLVAITAPCAFVNAPTAVLIGAVSGILVIVAVFFIDQKLRVDDPVGAIAVHGVNGLWGVLSLGLFADGTYGDGWNGVAGPVKGLFYGDPGQLLAQVIGSASCIAFVFVTMYVFFKISNKLYPMRPKPKDEIEGLDLPEMGVRGYEDATSPGQA